MSWFLKVLLQWTIIALFVCFPMVVTELWPFSGIFSAIVVFGLLAYGLFNPEYAIRRAFLWGCTTVVAASLSPANSISYVESAINSWDVTQQTSSMLLAAASFFLKGVVSWEAIIILVLLFLAEIFRMGREHFPPHLGGRTAKVSISDAFGSIMKPTSNSPRASAHIPISVSNAGDNDLHISGVRTSVLFFRNNESEIYSENEGDFYQIGRENPSIVPPGATKHYRVQMRDIDGMLNTFIRFLSSTRLFYLLDISGRVDLFGNNEMPKHGLRLLFKLYV